MARKGVEITGVKQTMAALKAFEPEVYKAMRKTIRTRIKSVATGAAGRYQSSSGGGGKYKVSIRDAGKRPGASITAVMGVQKGRNDWSDPQSRAVIFEFAGSRSRGKTPGIAAAIASFQAKYGAPGRFLWEEWDSQGGQKISEEVEAEIRDAERILQAKLDAAGEGY